MNSPILSRWLSLVIVGATVVVFSMLSARGLDFTDESFYLLNFLHWRELSGTVTFFGAFVEVPFFILGRDITAIRLFGLVALGLASLFFSRSLARYFADATSTELNITVIYQAAAAALIFTFYVFYLRTPSYNLVALFCILMSSGVVFRYLTAPPRRFLHITTGVIYGLILSVLTLTKATSGLATFALHLLLFLAHFRKASVQRLLAIIPGTVVGAAIVLGLLTALAPDWPRKLLFGVELANLMDDRANLAIDSINHFRWDLQSHIEEFWLPYSLFLGMHLLVSGLWRNRVKAKSWWILIVIAAFVVFLIASDRNTVWLPQLAFVIFIIWTTEVFSRSSLRLTAVDIPLVGLPILLAALSLSYSIGTNMSLLVHSKMALVLPGVALLLMLGRLHQLRLLAAPHYGLSMVLLCLPALAIVVWPWWDVDRTYRLHAPLKQQSATLTVGDGANEIMVDARTQRIIGKYQSILGASGFRQGVPMLDFTGQSPGLVYVAGAKPVGLAWLLGGYPGSSALTRRIMEAVESDQIGCAWLLSSPDSSRRIEDWRQIMEEQYGDFGHADVGRLTVPPFSQWRDESPEKMTIVVWSPVNPDCDQ